MPDLGETKRKKWDMRLDRFPRYPLAFLPSPVHPLKRLSRHLGDEVEIWAKREDICSGLAFGGNKVRKLEYLIPDALKQGCDTLVTIGGVQSNHTRQTAAVAAAVGLKCVLVQERWVDWPDAVYDKVGNILLSRILGAQTHAVGEGYSTQPKATWQDAIDSVKRSGGKPYAIPAGASDHPLGGLGYVNFAEEVRVQEQQLGVFFDHIVVAACTGSTHAGMLVGFLGQERPRRVIGVDVAANPSMTTAAVAKISRATADSVSLGKEVRDDDIVLETRYAGPAYGIPDKSTIEAIETAARLEGMLTDPVYEGKSMAALIGLVRSSAIPRSSKVLYVHLGGAPALNAYSGAFQY